MRVRKAEGSFKIGFIFQPVLFLLVLLALLTPKTLYADDSKSSSCRVHLDEHTRLSRWQRIQPELSRRVSRLSEGLLLDEFGRTAQVSRELDLEFAKLLWTQNDRFLFKRLSAIAEFWHEAEQTQTRAFYLQFPGNDLRDSNEFPIFSEFFGTNTEAIRLGRLAMLKKAKVVLKSSLRGRHGKKDHINVIAAIDQALEAEDPALFERSIREQAKAYYSGFTVSVARDSRGLPQNLPDSNFYEKHEGDIPKWIKRRIRSIHGSDYLSRDLAVSKELSIAVKKEGLWETFLVAASEKDPSLFVNALAAKGAEIFESLKEKSADEMDSDPLQEKVDQAMQVKDLVDLEVTVRNAWFYYLISTTDAAEVEHLSKSILIDEIMQKYVKRMLEVTSSKRAELEKILIAFHKGREDARKEITRRGTLTDASAVSLTPYPSNWDEIAAAGQAVIREFVDELERNIPQGLVWEEGSQADPVGVMRVQIHPQDLRVRPGSVPNPSREALPHTMIGELESQRSRVLTDLRDLLSRSFEKGRATAQRDGEGHFVQVFDTPPVQTQFDPSLAATLLFSNAGVITQENMEQGPLFVAWHGAGTVNSNVRSWDHLIEKIRAAGFNPLAHSLPLSGNGVRLRGSENVGAYLHYVLGQIHNRFIVPASPANTPSVARPLIVGGRSLGGFYSDLHGRLYGASDPVDVYACISFSNPFTIEDQVKNVYWQRDVGIIGGVVEETLEHARQVAQEFQNLLIQFEAAHPGFGELFGDHFLLLQGDADEDGGPNVLPELYRYRNKYMRLGHIYEFHDPRLGQTEIPHDEHEATHFLLSPNGKKVPGLWDQNFEVFAVMYGHLDYIIDSASPLLEMVQRRERLLRFRVERLGIDNETGLPLTFLKRFQRISKISDQELGSARIGREGGKAGRLKNVMEFWRKERTRVEGVLRENGIIQ